MLHTVPGPPTDAIVEVVDSTTVTVQWSAPVSDGGSQVTSYRVEWDTNPGEREEQAVTLSVDTGPNEVQTFSTVASDIDEVVSVHLRAALVEEVQTVTTSAFVDEVLAGSFALAFDTTASGGGASVSAAIAHDAGAMAGDGPARTTMEEILEAMPNVGDVTVSRDGPDDQGGYTWSITFHQPTGLLPLLQMASNSLSGTGAAVATGRVQPANVLSGTFNLQFESEFTGQIASDATEAEMKAALEALDAVDTVLVTRTGPDAQLGYSWFITFTSDEHFNSGDVSSLVGDFSLVSAVNATGYICENGDVVAGTPCDSLASVRGNQLGGFFDLFADRFVEVQRVALHSEAGVVGAGSSVTSGEFQVSYGGAFTSALNYDATAKEVQDALRLLGGELAAVEVQVLPTVDEPGMIDGDPTIQRAWYITFHGVVGAAAETVGTAVSGGCSGGACGDLLPSIAQGSTSNVVMVPGTEGVRVRDIPFDADAATFKAALEAVAVAEVGQVDVSRSGPTPQLEYTWTVSFVSMPGDIAQLQGSAANLTAVGAEFAVYTTHGGTVQEVQALTVGGLGATFDTNITLKFGTETTDAIYINTADCDASGATVDAELERLSGIGEVSVDVQSTTDGNCTWHITFDTNAGNLDILEVSSPDREGSHTGSTLHGLVSSIALDGGLPEGATAIVSPVREGTSQALGGDFTLTFRGQRTGCVAAAGCAFVSWVLCLTPSCPCRAFAATCRTMWSLMT